MKNNLLNEEIKRFFEIVNYGVIEEQLGLFLGKFGKEAQEGIIRTAIKDFIEKETNVLAKDAIEKAIKQGVSLPDILSNPSILKSKINDPSVLKSITSNVESVMAKKMNNPAFKLAGTDIMTIRASITNNADNIAKDFVSKQKSLVNKAGQTGAKESGQTAAKQAGQTGAKEAGDRMKNLDKQAIDIQKGLEMLDNLDNAVKKVDDIPAWKAAAQQAGDVPSRRIPKDDVLKGLPPGQRNLVSQSAEQISREAASEVNDLVAKAGTKEGLIPAAKKKVVDFLEKMKLVKADKVTGKRKMSALGWTTALVLGFGGVYLIGALSENGVDVEQTDTTGGGGSGETGGSGVTGWRSLGKQYDDQIKTALGLPTDTQLTDADIDTLYNKLKENGKI